MSFFAKHVMLASAAPVVQSAPGDDDVIVVAPGTDIDADKSLDPLDGVDQFADQRANLNASLGIENLTQELPVDGADDDLTIGKPVTDVDVAEGDHGEGPTITGPEDDKTFDHDDSEVEFDASMAQEDQMLDQFEGEQTLLEEMASQMTMLVDSSIAIESFGFNPTAAAILQTTGLLNGTALESLALESLSFSAGKSAESQMALEAIGEKIKDTSAKWSAKVLSVAAGAGDKIMSVLTPLWDKVSGLVSKLASASWDKAKAAGATVKAHPYATVGAVIASIAAVAGVIAFTAGGMPAMGAKVDVMKSFLGSIVERVNKVKFPFGKFKASVSDNGMKLLTSVDGPKGVFNVADTKTISELGWTQKAVAAMKTQLDRAWAALKPSLSALSARASKVAGGALGAAGDVYKGADTIEKVAMGSTFNAAKKVFGKSAGGTMAAGVAGIYVGTVAVGAYIMAIVGVITGLFKIARYIVVGGLRLIASTLRAIMPGSAAPAAA
jgi:hypothetical protein